MNGESMNQIKNLIPFADDILVGCALVSFVVASYLVNAVLGTYVLGIAFFVAAVFAAQALGSPWAAKLLNGLKRKRKG